MLLRRKDILYMGDTSLGTAALYLSLILEESGFSYDYVASADIPTEDIGENRYGLYILSDYPAARLDHNLMRSISDSVARGAGLLMIGGWESFQGLGGGYHGTRIGEVLPVNVSPDDDRINSARPCCVVKKQDHVILDGLPFDSPPLVAGYNRFTVKGGGREILSVARYRTLSSESGKVSFSETDRDPFMVLGSFQKGRTAAVATDLAPHWVGGFVDWGDRRLALAASGREVEVGDLYLRFTVQLLRWCMGLSGPS